MRSPLGIVLVFCLVGSLTVCQRAQGQTRNPKYGQPDVFRQLDEILPTPNEVRLASGVPGPKYWQQRVNYEIDVELDDVAQRIVGREKITYVNQSPHELSYLWLQLDPNLFARGSDAALTAVAPKLDKLSFDGLATLRAREIFDGGVKITSVHDGRQQSLPFTVVKTMMRVELPRRLKAGETFSFRVAWHFQINNCRVISGRTGYEFFEKDGNYLYTIAQWYPRLVAYTDYGGWQHKQYLGDGEFTLELGDYLVRITAPEDHIVAATGALLNGDEVLTAKQRKRLAEARKADRPVFVVTREEAEANEGHQSQGKKTWIFKADNVRDVAFASSRKFIWDALLHRVDGRDVMAMSYYPKEGEPLWSRYSTHAIIHTLDVYSRYTFTYPYPVAISVNGPIFGMEYPMICFNGPRPEEDGTYSKRTKYALISVIIHEVGHNYFPMIVNSDERQWTWMDEGLNTFLQYLAEQEWEDNYPSRRGEPKKIVGYMRAKKQVPIMTNAESLLQKGSNAYSKPAAALNILRETVLGRELFDYAFKRFAREWMFKRPTPADFFRCMEDASGVDLDWFWRGWFYGTEHTDLGVDELKLYTMESPNPDVEKARKKVDRGEEPETLSGERNKPLPKRVQRYEELKDFYNAFDDLDVTDLDRRNYNEFLEKLDDDERKLLDETRNFYVVELSNRGGLVMPVILGYEFEDGTAEEVRVPAEIWRKNNERVGKLLITSKTLKAVVLDPRLETADVDRKNNYWPRQVVKSRFQVFKEKKEKNAMQKAKGDVEETDDSQSPKEGP